MHLLANIHLEFEIPCPSPFHFMLRPRNDLGHVVELDEYETSAKVTVKEFADLFGNRFQRLVAPPGPFEVAARSKISGIDQTRLDPGARFVPVDELPVQTLPFLLPSRYCESDRFSQMAFEIISEIESGYEQCEAIVDYVRRTIEYSPGSGNAIISATEVNQQTQAVCRDMAHLGIALCRAAAIPARFVVGYLAELEPMDMHAWFEAFVGGKWYTFDPTQPDLSGCRAAIAYGRDAADVAVYSQFGPPVTLLNMEVKVESS